MVGTCICMSPLPASLTGNVVLFLESVYLIISVGVQMSEVTCPRLRISTRDGNRLGQVMKDTCPVHGLRDGFESLSTKSYRTWDKFRICLAGELKPELKTYFTNMFLLF